MYDVRGKKEEFYDGRWKREEGRILRWKREEGRRKKFQRPLQSLLLYSFSTSLLNVSWFIFLHLVTSIFTNSSLRRKKEDVRRKSFMMEEGRSKMEDVTFRPTHRLSSCILLPVSLLILQHHRICFGIVYHRGNRCDVRGQSNTKILLLLSMLWSSCS